MRRATTLVVLLVLGTTPVRAQSDTGYPGGEPRMIEVGGRRVAAIVDPDSGVPSWIMGVDSLDFNLGHGTEMRSEEEVVRRADLFLRTIAEAFRIDPTILSLPVVRSLGDLWFVSYAQRSGTGDPYRTRVALTVHRTGRVIAFGAYLEPADVEATGPASRSRSNTAPVAATLPMDTGASGGSVTGTVTLNAYRTPDDYYAPLERLLGVAFAGARVEVDSTVTFADEQGQYTVAGIPTVGSHTIRFVMETDRARIASGVPDSQRVKTFDFEFGPGASQVRFDFDWQWGDEGDADGSVTAMGLNTVYQIRSMDDWITEVTGYRGMTLRPPLVLHLLRRRGCGGCTDPGTGDLTLGRQFALSGEVVRHEYVHNVLFAVSGNRWLRAFRIGGDPLYDPFESYALDEGFADYFACASTDNYAFGGPLASAKDPSFPGGEGVVVRLLYNVLTMGDYRPEENQQHHNGNIIAGTVWKIRSAYGVRPDEIDGATFLALAMEPQPQSFHQFALNLIAADAYLNEGRNVRTIERHLVDRGHIPPFAPGALSVAVHDSLAVFAWSDRSGMEDGYRVEVRTPGGAWTTVAETGPDSFGATARIAACNGGEETWEYRVRVFYMRSGLSAVSPPELFNPCAPAISTGAESIERPGVGSSIYFERLYPQPAQAEVHVDFAVPAAMSVQLMLFDALGRRALVLDDATRGPGTHSIQFDSSRLPAGVYVLALVTTSGVIFRPIVVTR